MIINEKMHSLRKKVDWNKVIKDERFKYIFETLDYFGECALTENKQLVVNGKICSYECYKML